MKYVKKPVVVDAWPARDLSSAAANAWRELPYQVANAYEKGGWVFLDDGSISIPTLEGTMLANPDDMVIMGVNGEFYPCKPDVFSKTYEATVTIPVSLEQEVVQNKRLRAAIDGCIQEVMALPSTRERSISITKLQEAVMWLGMDLKRLREILGTVDPYPSSKDASSGSTIEPTADNLKL